MKWWLMIGLLVAGVWFVSKDSATATPETAPQTPAASVSSGDGVGRVVADTTLAMAQMDVSAVGHVTEKLKSACGRNKYGLSEEACLAKIDAREDICVKQITNRYPGAMSDTSKMQQVVSDYVKCIFEEA